MHAGEHQGQVIAQRDGVGYEGEEDLQVDEGGSYDPSFRPKSLLPDVLVGLGAGILFEALPYDM